MSSINFKWNGDIAKKIVSAAIKEAVGDTCNYILQESKKDSPIESGTLVSSAGMDVVANDNKADGTIYYDTPYAVRVHELPESEKNKYLEKPFNQNSKKLIEFLSKIKF